jgi:hypothetical protein
LSESIYFCAGRIENVDRSIYKNKDHLSSSVKQISIYVKKIQDGYYQSVPHADSKFSIVIRSHANLVFVVAARAQIARALINHPSSGSENHS